MKAESEKESELSESSESNESSVIEFCTDELQFNDTCMDVCIHDLQVCTITYYKCEH